MNPIAIEVLVVVELRLHKQEHRIEGRPQMVPYARLVAEARDPNAVIQDAVLAGLKDCDQKVRRRGWEPLNLKRWAERTTVDRKAADLRTRIAHIVCTLREDRSVEWVKMDVPTTELDLSKYFKQNFDELVAALRIPEHVLNADARSRVPVPDNMRPRIIEAVDEDMQAHRIEVPRHLLGAAQQLAYVERLKQELDDRGLDVSDAVALESWHRLRTPGADCTVNVRSRSAMTVAAQRRALFVLRDDED